MPDEETRYVSWYMCNCEWVSKYCDEYHRAGARVPLSVLEQYEIKEIRYND